MGGGSSSTTFTIGYKYHVGVDMACLHGPADEVTGIKVGDYLAWAGSITENGPIDINEPELYGGDRQEGGVVGRVDVEMGGAEQPANDYLQSVLGAAIPAFRGVLRFVLRQVYVGNNPYIKPWSFLVRHTSHGDWYLEKSRIRDDNNPIHMIRACLTNRLWGLGHPADDIDNDWFMAAADTLHAEGFGLSMLWDRAVDIEGFILEILRHIDAALYVEPTTGKFRIKLIRNDFDPETLPVLDASVITEVTSFMRRGHGELVNTVVLKYLEHMTGLQPWKYVEGVPPAPIDWSILHWLEHSPSGKYVVSQGVGANPTIVVVRTSDWSVVQLPDLDYRGSVGGHFSNDEEYFFTALHVYPYFAVIRVSDWSHVPTPDIALPTIPLSIGHRSPDGRYLGVRFSPGIHIVVVDTFSRSIVPNLEYLGDNTVYGVEFSPTVMAVVVAQWSLDSSVVLYDTRTWRIIQTPTPIAPDGYYQVEFSPDFSQLWITQGISPFLRVYNTANWWPVTSHPPISKRVNFYRFSLDGRFFVYGHENNDPPYLVIWRTSDWTIISDVHQPPSSLADLQFTVDSDFLLVFTYEMPYIYVLRTSDWLLVPTGLDTDEHNALGRFYGKSLSPDGNYLVRKAPAAYGGMKVISLATLPGDDVEQSVTVHNTGLINQMGEMVPQEISMMGISQPGLANQVAARELAQLSAELAFGSFLTNRQAAFLRPGAPFKLNFPKYGIESEVMRTLEIDLGTLEDGKIKLSASSDVSAVPVSVYSDPEPTKWVSVINPPQASAVRGYAEATYWALTRLLGESASVWSELDPLEGLLLTTVGKPTSDSFDYGLHIDSGSGFNLDGRWGFTPYAYINAALGREVSSVVEVTNGRDLSSVVAGGYGYLGEEIVGVHQISGTTITLLRGLLDTVPQEHPAGTLLWFADGHQGRKAASNLSGEQVGIKVTPRTSKGELSVDMAPTDYFTFGARYIRPYPPGNFKINGEYPSTGELLGDLQLTWAHRDRLQQTAYLVAQNEGNIGPETGTTYRVRVVSGGTELVNQAGITAAEYLLTEAVLQTGRLTITVTAERDGYVSWQSQSATVDYYTLWQAQDLTTPLASVVVGTEISGDSRIIRVEGLATPIAELETGLAVSGDVPAGADGDSLQVVAPVVAVGTSLIAYSTPKEERDLTVPAPTVVVGTSVT